MPAGSGVPNASLYSKIKGGEAEFNDGLALKVEICGVSANINTGLFVDANEKVSSLTTVLTTSTGTFTDTLLAAQGATTNSEIRGFSFCNESTQLRRFEVRLKGNRKGFLSLSSVGGAFNWNLVNGVFRDTNAAIDVHMNGAGTATVTVLYKTK